MKVENVLERLCASGGSLYDRGYAFGSTGNLSVRLGDEVWITPTGRPLRGLAPSDLACIDMEGMARNSTKPSKELPFHLAIYRERAQSQAVIHLHSTYSVAISCLEELDPGDALPPITPYYAMRVAPLAIVPYFRPGSLELAHAVGEAASSHVCILLRNHGMIALGSDLNEAMDRTEELEQTARLYFLLRNERTLKLSPKDVKDLRHYFPQR